MTSLNVTFLSNGYGEDSIAASLITVLQKQKTKPHFTIQAFPTVDEGNAYLGLDIPVLGPRKSMPSGGLLMHNWQLFKTDIQAGFIPMTLQQLKDLKSLKTDVLIVVGDAFALLLSSLVSCKHRFYIQTLVSAHHQKQQSKNLNRFFMENLSYPERALTRHLVEQLYVRDDLTASKLKEIGIKHVSSLGNPMLDKLKGSPMPFKAPVIALLPGTRQYAKQSLSLMLESLTQLTNTIALVAWAGSELPHHFDAWQSVTYKPQEGLIKKLELNSNTVFIFEGRFADVLHSADLVLGTAGTANEQAAALAKPVVSFPLEPLYSLSFLENQKRLLSHALSISEPDPQSIATSLKYLLNDKQAYQQAAATGKERMGKAGGSEAIIKDILKRVLEFESLD